MTKKATSWLRIALIRWFVYDNVPLVGDLIEESAHRSRSWFWRQLIFAVLARFTTVARAALRDPFKRSASNAAGLTSIGTLKQPPIQLTSSRRGVAARFFEDTVRDIRGAVRIFSKSRSFSVAAVLSLALGIGPGVAIFSVVDAIMLNPLPYDTPEQLIAIHGTSSKSTASPVSYPNYLDWRRRVRSVEDIAAWHLEMFTLRSLHQSERLIGGRVSAG